MAIKSLFIDFFRILKGHKKSLNLWRFHEYFCFNPFFTRVGLNALKDLSAAARSLVVYNNILLRDSAETFFKFFFLLTTFYAFLKGQKPEAIVTTQTAKSIQKRRKQTWKSVTALLRCSEKTAERNLKSVVVEHSLRWRKSFCFYWKLNKNCNKKCKTHNEAFLETLHERKSSLIKFKLHTSNECRRTFFHSFIAFARELWLFVQ